MIKLHALSIVIVAAAACGPDANQNRDWIVGTFSNTSAGVRGHDLAVQHYEFDENGTLSITALSGCQENEEQPLHEYKWNRTDENVIEVELPDDGSGIDAWRITPGRECSKVVREELSDGEVVDDPSTLVRGAVCMSDLPPCPEGTECDSCETVWCDEAPSDCDDA